MIAQRSGRSGGDQDLDALLTEVTVARARARQLEQELVEIVASPAWRFAGRLWAPAGSAHLAGPGVPPTKAGRASAPAGSIGSPPQYHDEDTLVYRIYGHDLLPRLESLGSSVGYVDQALPHWAAPRMNMIVCRKGAALPDDSAGAIRFEREWPR